MERRLDPWLKAMKELVKKKSESLNMPAPLLAQARTLESLVVATAAGKHELPEELRGWRETVVGTPLMSELQRLAGA
jgi:ribonuclease D